MMKHLPLQNPEYISLREGFQEWLATLGYSSAVVSGSPSYLNEFLHWLEQQQLPSIADLHPHQVSSYVAYLQSRNNQRRRGLISNSSFNSRSLVLEQFSQYLLKEHSLIIPIKISRLPTQPPQRAILTQSEIAQLYQSLASDYLGIRDRAALGLFYGCGLRSSEGRNLDINDVLFERNLIHVKRSKNHYDRLVPMTAAIKKDLHNYLLYSRPYLCKQRTGNSFLVGKRGHRPQADSLRYRLVQLIEKSGIDLNGRAIGLHSLRHSIATHLLQKGMKLEDIRQFLGHLSLESTQIYTHIVHEIQ